MAAISGDWNWRRAVASSKLKATTKHVLLTLSLHASEAGTGIFPSVATLARETSLTRKAVQVHLRLAADAGWIRKAPRFEDGRQTSNGYELSAPEGEGAYEVRGGGVRRGRGEGVRGYLPVKGSEGKDSSNELTLFADGELTAHPADRFAELWELHPRGSKKEAHQQYLKATYRNGKPPKIDHDTMLACLQSYVDTELRPGFNGVHLVRWIRGEMWEQELAKERSGSRGGGRPEYGRLRVDD